MVETPACAASSVGHTRAITSQNATTKSEHYNKSKMLKNKPNPYRLPQCSCYTQTATAYVVVYDRTARNFLFRCLPYKKTDRRRGRKAVVSNPIAFGKRHASNSWRLPAERWPHPRAAPHTSLHTKPPTSGPSSALKYALTQQTK